MIKFILVGLLTCDKRTFGYSVPVREKYVKIPIIKWGDAVMVSGCRVHRVPDHPGVRIEEMYHLQKSSICRSR